MLLRRPAFVLGDYSVLHAIECVCALCLWFGFEWLLMFWISFFLLSVLFRYVTLVQRWRGVYLPTLCHALTHAQREVRVRAPVYLLTHVLTLDPLCLVHVLLGLQHQPCDDVADDAMTPADRRLWAAVSVRDCAGCCQLRTRRLCGESMRVCCVCFGVRRAGIVVNL